MSELLRDSEFWVVVATVLFVGVLLWQKVPAMLARALDARAAAIARELENARKLREEAEALLAQYQKKRSEADKEAEAIITEARGEAARYASEARAAIAAQIKRRAKQAEERIAQAEAQAIAEVRAAAADTAVAAAGKLIAAKLDGKGSAELIQKSLSAIPDKLN